MRPIYRSTTDICGLLDRKRTDQENCTVVHGSPPRPRTTGLLTLAAATHLKTKVDFSFKPIPLQSRELTFPSTSPYFLHTPMLETLLLSATYITVVPQSISNLLVAPEASQKSTISGSVTLSSKAIYGIKTLFLFTESDLKTVLIPVVSFYVNVFCS